MRHTRIIIGGIALAQMLYPQLGSAAKAAKQGGFYINGEMKKFDLEPKIKRVIVLTMAGGPSHLETLDPKPELGKLDVAGLPISKPTASVAETNRAGRTAPLRGRPRLSCDLLASPWPERRFSWARTPGVSDEGGLLPGLSEGAASEGGI